MKTDQFELNPYQVKSKRFQRSTIDCELKQQSSMEKVKSLISIRYPFHPKEFTAQNENNLKNAKSIQTNKGKDKAYQQNIVRLNSAQKSKLKRTKPIQNQQNNFQQRQAVYLRLLNEKQQKIQTLIITIKQKQLENINLLEKLRSYQSIHTQNQKIQQKCKQQLSKMQSNHTQQAYRLKQNIKKLQIDVNCINRKWSLDFEKMLKEKQQQIKNLRQKYTSLLKSNRLKSQQSIPLSIPSSLNLLHTQNNRQQSDLLDLSSFQLSKQMQDNQQFE